MSFRRVSGYGWHPDQPDGRDHLYHEHNLVAQANQLPLTSMIPTTRTPPIWSQLQLGSCTAHGALRIYMIEAIRQGLGLPMLSRLFNYWTSGELEGTAGQDVGRQVRDAVAALARFGACQESIWPYLESQEPVQPPSEAFTLARRHMAVRYQRIIIGAGAPIRTALHSGQAVAFGFSVPQYFEDGSWDPTTDPLPLPTPYDGFIGGHCVALTGYDFSRTQFPVNAFLVDNSWGVDWGLGGRFWIDARWFDPSRGLAADLWTIQKVT